MEQYLDAIQNMFDKFDADGDGKITKTEIQKLFIASGIPISKPEMDHMFSTIDTDGDEAVSKDEICIYMNQQQSGFSLSMLAAEVFQKYDEDNDGFITFEEVQKMCDDDSNCDVEILKTYFDKADTDEDGKISFYEWKNVIQMDDD